MTLVQNLSLSLVQNLTYEMAKIGLEPGLTHNINMNIEMCPIYDCNVHKLRGESPEST